MSAREAVHDRFEMRRHKERVAFLVVKFLRVHAAFTRIAAEFQARENGTAESLAGSGLFEKVRELTGSIAFDLKEMAHTLFRSDSLSGQTRTRRGKRQVLAGRKDSIERLSLDSYIGTGYHLLLILQESLYQLERYAPELGLTPSPAMRRKPRWRACARWKRSAPPSRWSRSTWRDRC